MAKAFQELGFNCHYFDADMPDNEKLLILEQFETGIVNMIFATSAFGMGIDIPDIRVVVHYLVPESIEQYYQEVGRAGRDGKDAYGYLLYSETNFKVRRDLIKKSLLKQERIKDIFENTIKPTSNTSAIIKKKKVTGATITADKIYSLSRMDVREDNSEMIIFLFLLQNRIIKLHGKGVQFFDCFENNDSSLYLLMKEASVNGLVIRIAKKLAKSVEQINHDIFVMFNQNEIKLSRVPINVLYYTIDGALSDDVIEEIHDLLKDIMISRLENFEKLVEIINSRTDIVKSISSHLGIN